MSLPTLKAKVKRLAEELAPHGFEHAGPFLLKRSRPNLDQFIELQPGRRSLEGKFICNVAWKFNLPEVPGDNMFHASVRPTETWFAHEPKEALDQSYARLLRLIQMQVLPLLNSIDSIEKVVAQYEQAMAKASGESPEPTSALFFFSRDEGWKHFFLGLCYKHLTRLHEAKAHLEDVITKHSAHPLGWVAERRVVAEKIIRELG